MSDPDPRPLGESMTADLAQTPDLDEMGPVDYIVLAFPTSRMTGEALPMLIDLVEEGSGSLSPPSRAGARPPRLDAGNLRPV